MAIDLNEIGKPLAFRCESEVETTSIASCPVCGGSSREHVARCFDYELETCSNPWDIWSCNSCSAQWLDPRPAVTALSVIYPPHYYSYDMSKKISPFVLKGKDFLDRMKMRGIISSMTSSPRTFMDIGCGDGRYLRLMNAFGLEKSKITGVELSCPAIDQLRADGFTVLERRVEECTEIADGSVDLMTMFHVIEHVDDPAGVLRRLRSWLSPQGLLVLETPNTDSLDARLFRRTWWGGYHIPRHWTLFDPRSIRVLLERAGFELVDVRYQTGHSFWLYSFHHLLKYRFEMPRLAIWFDPIQSRIPLMAATGFDLLRRSVGLKTSAILVMARPRP